MYKTQFSMANALMKVGRAREMANVTRYLSTSVAREEVVNKKTIYKQQLSELRKKWTSEHEERIAVEVARRKEERRKIVVQKAIRLRERNVVSAQNIVKDRERKAAAMTRYREHVIKNNLVAEKRVEVTSQQYEKLVADLMEEKKCWIDTPEKVDIMINDSLFDGDKPATTGIHTSSSEHWRHMCVPFNLDVLFDAGFQDRYGPSDASPEERYLEAMSAKRLQVREMVESMIGSGQDRQHMREIVDKYVELYTDNDALLESADFLDEEEEFIAEMQEESGLDGEDEEKLFQFIEHEISQASGGSYVQGSMDEDEDGLEDEEEEEEVPDLDDGDDDAVSVAMPARASFGMKKEGIGSAPVAPRRRPPNPNRRSKGTENSDDVEGAGIDMSIFDTAEENMSRDLGEDVTGAAAAAAAKKANLMKSQSSVKKGKAAKKK